MSIQSHSRKQKRLAVLTLELAQGICFATWASRLPDIKSSFSVENLAYLGMLMSLIPIGKFVAIPVVNRLFTLIGNRKTLLVSILGYACSLFLLALLPLNIFSLGAGFVFFGIFWNMTDISLNTQAIEVDRLYEQSIIATFHSGWSFAACIGALIGYLMKNQAIGYNMHFIVMATIVIAVILIAYRYLPLDKDAQSIKQEELNVVTEKTEKAGHSKIRFPELLLIQLGIIWLLALIVENTMFEWSDIYFESVIDASPKLQVGSLVFLTMMFVGRLLTNWVYRFWSKRTVLMVAGVLIFAGFIISSLFVGMSKEVGLMVVINSLGFTLIGLGISCVVPTLYSIVSDKSKTPVSRALTIMSTISFIGPIAAPLLVGFISNHSSLKTAYLVIGLFGLLILLIPLLSKTLRR